MPFTAPLPTYTTRDEVNFLAELKTKNPAAYAKYAALIRGNMRAFDPLVNVTEVKRALDSLEAVGILPSIRFRGQSDTATESLAQ